MDHQQLLDAIVSFAEHSDSVAALILIGSRARKQRHADEYSDIDVLMVVDEPDRFLSSDEWLSGIGTPHVSFIETTFDGDQERRILFDNASDVDFVFISRQHAKQVVESNVGMDILSRGFRVLVNKTDLRIPPLTDPCDQGYPVPGEDEYKNTVHDFWYHTVWTTKKLLRKELWAAKFCVDNYMKWKLLWMIEQYEHAIHGQSYHTWYGGRFVDSWAEPDVAERLRKTFAHYDAKDMAAALWETMNLFRDLSKEVSNVYGLEYPAHADEYATGWVRAKISAITKE